MREHRTIRSAGRGESKPAPPPPARPRARGKSILLKPELKPLSVACDSVSSHEGPLLGLLYSDLLIQTRGARSTPISAAGSD